MPTLRERFTDLLLGDQRRKLEESAQLLYNAYLEGPFVLPPDQLLAQLKEQDAALLTDLVHQLYWEHLGTPGYSLDLTAERGRAIDESRRLWKYNPLAQWMIWLWTNYGFGENIVITPEDEDAIETWEEFWKADRNQAVLAQDRIADRLSNWLLVDGGRFLAFYASTLDGEATVRRINTKEITEIVTDPADNSVPLFYKRQWTTSDSHQRTMYYPDWEAFFAGEKILGRAKLPRDAIRADQFRQWGENGPGTSTTVCILHISFNGKDEDSLYGWPLLAAGSPWVRSQKRFLEARLSVAQSKAMYVRKATTKGGSRAVDAVTANIQSALSRNQAYETNPPAVAGSTLVENQAVTTTDFPMTTGASDAKTDGEMFSWMAGLSGGVFPHYMGLGDAYRLATATSMEKPLEMQFSRYQVFWSAQFRKMVRIVLQMDEKYGDATYQTYEAEVSTDKMVEVDLDGMSMALGRVFTTIINPQAELGALPAEVTQGMLKASLKTILQALGVDAEAVVGDEVWEVEEEGEIEEGGPGSGWFAPPKGTHGKGWSKKLKKVQWDMPEQGEITDFNLQPSFAPGWGKENFKDWLDDLSDKEHTAIQTYTAHESGHINNYLRGKYTPSGKYYTKERLNGWVSEIDNALGKSEIPHDVIVYRTFGTFDIEQLEPGTIFQDKAFVSTSLVSSGSEIFRKRENFAEIHIPKGIKAAYVSFSKIGEPGEHEILLAKGQKFHVIGKEGDTVIMEVVP